MICDLDIWANDERDDAISSIHAMMLLLLVAPFKQLLILVMNFFIVFTI